MVFKSKKDKFGTLLSNIVENLKIAVDYFTDYRLHNVSDLKVFTETLKEYEHKGDQYVHEIIKELNKTFITPIEREDILLLAMSMDDVLDGIEHGAALFDMYSIVNPDEFMKEMARQIQQAIHEMEQAIDLLSMKKLKNIQGHAIKIKEYESTCDLIHRKCIKHLFEVEKDAVRIIQYKEVYETLESIADYCENVANTLETIIMKNA